jgi:hypothetical protein
MAGMEMSSDGQPATLPIATMTMRRMTATHPAIPCPRTDIGWMLCLNL